MKSYFLNTCFTIGLLASIISCTKETDYIRATGIAINPSNLIMNPGDTYTLKAYLNPSSIKDQLSWTSTNNSVTTVNDSGTITAVAPGVDTIRVTSSDGRLTATCEVTVTKWKTHLTGQMIISMEADTRGNIWAGTITGLLHKYNGTVWTEFLLWPDFMNYSIEALTADKDGTIWIGTYFGLSNFDGNNVRSADTTNSGFYQEHITSITIDEQGVKWCGTGHSGVFRYDGTNWKRYNKGNSGLSSNYINNIVIDKSGRKWIATNGGGISVFDNNTWVTYDTENSALLNRWVHSLFIDSQDVKWFGTSGGVSVFDGSGWKGFNSLTFVKAVVKDPKGYIWFGTEAGLFKFDGKTWTSFTKENSGLISNLISCIVIDKNGTKWIGTNTGVSELQDY